MKGKIQAKEQYKGMVNVSLLVMALGLRVRLLLLVGLVPLVLVE